MTFFMFLVLVSTSFLRAHGFVDADKYVCRCEKFAYQNKPFVAIWNSPTNGCDFNFSTPINLRRFGIEENDHQTWDGKHVTVFSSAQLGLYPYFILNGEKNYNGGLPQTVDLGQHLRKARKDILSKIPDPNYDGLAVIDWEQWRPLWDTNWDPKKIYKVKSVDLVRNKHPDWTLGRILEEAKKEFEEAARALFEHTITIGKELRPKALWGFYGFPDCYGTEKDDYQCIEKTKRQNDQLEWLFSASSALFPSMYLQSRKSGNHNFVLGRLRETLRFATKGFGPSRRNIPIFVYHRNIYDKDEHAYNFLQKDDLERTIAVSADLGTAGVVIWGNRFDENTSPEVCRKIENYVQTTLGPYLQTKFREVQRCSTTKCHSHGHCVDKALLTPELLKRYETAQGSVHNCSQEIRAIPARVMTPVRSEIPTHHGANQGKPMQSKAKQGDDVSNIMQTLRDRNREINEAFQASQNGLSRKMGEFFDAMYTNSSIANSTGAHSFAKKTAISQNTRKQDFNNLHNLREKELLKEHKGPIPNVKEVVPLPEMRSNNQNAAVTPHENKVEPSASINAKEVEAQTVPKGKKSEPSVMSHLPNPNSLKSSKSPELITSSQGNVSKPHTQLQGNKPSPIPSVNIHTNKSISPETLQTKKTEPPKNKSIPKQQEKLIGKKPEPKTALKEKAPKPTPNVKEAVPHPAMHSNNQKAAVTPPAKVNVKNAELASSAHMSTQKGHQPLNEKKVGQSVTNTSKAHPPITGKYLDLSATTYGNKSKPLKTTHVIKSDPAKTAHTNKSKASTLDVNKPEKSTILNINKGDSAANVKKSDIPKQPQKEKNQMEMALDIGSENEQRASLEVLGQSSNVEKNVNGVKSNHFATKDHNNNHNNTEDVKASRKSEIAGSKRDASWMMMPSKVRHKSWIPHIYVVLIGISIAGALMFSLMFVAAYYYVSLRHHPMIRRESVDPENDTTQNTYLSPKGHSSPISSPNLSKCDKSSKSKRGKDAVDIPPNRKDEYKVKTPPDDLRRNSRNEININVDDKAAIKTIQSPTANKNINTITPPENEKVSSPSESKKIKSSLDVPSPPTIKKEKTPTDSKVIQPPISSYKKLGPPTGSKKMQRSFSTEATPRSYSSKISQIAPSENSAVNKEPSVTSSNKRSRSSSRDKKIASPPECRNVESQTKVESLQKLSDLKAGSKPSEKNKKPIKTKIPNLESITGKRVGGKLSSDPASDLKLRKELHKGSTSLPTIDVGEDGPGGPHHDGKKSSVSSRRWKQNTTLPELSKITSKKQNISKDNSLDISEIEIDINNMR